MLIIVAVAIAVVSVAQTPAAPADPIELVKQGRTLVADGRIDEGLALYTRALEAKPDLGEAHLAAGIALDLQSRFAEARRHLSRALELATDENRGQALTALAVSYAFEGNAKEAATFYQRQIDTQAAASNFADAAAAANALGRVFLETGNVTDAHRWYQTGYEYATRQPDSPGAQLTLWKFRWLHAQGRIAARAGHADEARRLVADARALVEATPSLKDQVPTLQYLAGYVAVYGKDYAAAAEALQQADARDPFVLALLAEAYAGQGDTARARETWERVLNVRSHNLQNAFARPRAMKALGR
jgi:tetratricopeptide (TPR) repeat protein